MKIPYIAKNFSSPKYSSLNGNGELDCSWSDIVRSAITVGREGWREVIQHGPYSYLEIIYRATLVRANLRSANMIPDLICKSQAYIGLDPSEKSAISYFTGLFVGKLFAEKLLGVPWLIHVDLYQGQLNFLNRHHPDLIGLNQSKEWTIIEAKGRSNRLNEKVLEKAKQQTRSLIQIDGQHPKLRVALGSHFSKDNLEVILIDPELYQADQFEINLDISPEQFVIDYYRPINDLVEHSDSFDNIYGNRSYRMVNIQEIDIQVGLDENIYSYLQEDPSLIFSTDYSENIIQFRDNFGDGSIGIDGIVVIVGSSWTS